MNTRALKFLRQNGVSLLIIIASTIQFLFFANPYLASVIIILAAVNFCLSLRRLRKSNDLTMSQ